jgi:hypothetical protein
MARQTGMALATSGMRRTGRTTVGMSSASVAAAMAAASVAPTPTIAMAAAAVSMLAHGPEGHGNEASATSQEA